MERIVKGQRVLDVGRRGKYLLIRLERGTLLLHLGMTGSVRILPAGTPAEKHDHVDLVLSSGNCLRLSDPRRFGALLWTTDDPSVHPLLRDLGPEPLTEGFDGDHLYRLSRARRVAVKPFIMNAHIVVGVGNIYASEALFRAKIHPHRPSNRIALSRYRRLAGEIKQVLAESIEQGGTTLQDFVREDGRPGYFRQSLRVYGRAGQECPRCGGGIRMKQIGQRSSFFCPNCQI